MRDDLDFSAWEAPPPPDGLADAVVARLGGTAVGLAMPDADMPRRRRWVIAASAAAVLVAAAGVWAIVRGREPAPAQNGAVIADRAQHIELGGVSVDLDRGADIHWHRTRDGLDIDQRAGTAVWRVNSDERIVIGATSASIEAAGASLRVEVPMNMLTKTDARMIGASALTAAAVAMVTVVVYDGHVKVSSSGQTVVVQPGTTYTVRMPGPEPVVAGTPATVAQADAPSGDAVEQLLAPHDGELAACLASGVRTATLKLTLAPDGSVAADETDDDGPSDSASCMLDVLGTIAFPASTRGGQYTHRVTRPACDADALAQAGNALMSKSDFNGALAKYEELIACKADQRSYQFAFMAACSAKNVTKAAEAWTKLKPASQNMVLQICVRNGITREQLEPSSCDVDALIRKGTEAEATGDHVTALARFEDGIRCQPSTRLYQLSFMMSCNAKSVSKASYYWHKLTNEQQQQLKQVCVRFGITEEMLDGGAPAAAPGLAPGQGQLRIDGIPPAKVLLDGIAVGSTPALVKASAGKHKVTYVIGNDRFTFPVTVKAGVTETLSKDLQ